MINLLPSSAKKELRAARANVTLLNYILMLGAGVVFLTVLCTAVYFVLNDTKNSAETLINENQSKSTAFGTVQAQGESLRSSLSSAKTILNQEVLYTNVITGIASLVPEGVVLDALNLSPTTFGSPTDLQIYAKSNEAALSLKDSLQNSPLFSSVSFQTLSSSGKSSTYPVNATLSLIINKSAAK